MGTARSNPRPAVPAVLKEIKTVRGDHEEVLEILVENDNNGH